MLNPVRHAVDSSCRGWSDACSDFGPGRAYPLKRFSESDKSAIFAVISIHGSYVPQVRFLNGAEELREAESAIAAIKFNTVFPDEAPTRIFRGGNLSCPHVSEECRFILFPYPARDLFPHKVP